MERHLVGHRPCEKARTRNGGGGHRIHQAVGHAQRDSVRHAAGLRVLASHSHRGVRSAAQQRERGIDPRAASWRLQGVRQAGFRADLGLAPCRLSDGFGVGDAQVVGRVRCRRPQPACPRRPCRFGGVGNGLGFCGFLRIVLHRRRNRPNRPGLPPAHTQKMSVRLRPGRLKTSPKWPQTQHKA